MNDDYWDDRGNGTDEQTIIKENHFDDDTHMNIYVIGGHTASNISIGFQVRANGQITDITGRGAGGIADPQQQVIFIQGSYNENAHLEIARPSNLDFLKERQLATLAHEIGHNLVGAGHPNQSDGPAPRTDTYHPDRLMASGGISPTNTPNLMVKGEWDEAEVTLNNFKFRDANEEE